MGYLVAEAHRGTEAQSRAVLVPGTLYWYGTVAVCTNYKHTTLVSKNVSFFS